MDIINKENACRLQHDERVIDEVGDLGGMAGGSYPGCDGSADAAAGSCDNNTVTHLQARGCDLITFLMSGILKLRV